MVLDLALPSLGAILSARTLALDEPLALYAAAARDLRDEAPARAEFIERQCAGEIAEDLFDRYREAWGITPFEDDLVSAHDFRRGFLYVFRDHTDSWSDNLLARHFFYTSAEAQFSRRYELWAVDHDETEERVDLREGSWRSIVHGLFHEEEEYAALVSPAFGAAEFSEIARKLRAEEPDLKEVLAEIAVQRGS